MSGGADSFCPRFPGPKEKNQNDGHEPFGSDHGCLVQRNQGGTCMAYCQTSPRPAPSPGEQHGQVLQSQGREQAPRSEF